MVNGPPFDPIAEATQLRRRLERLAARPAWGRRKIFLRIGVPNLRQVIREEWATLKAVEGGQLVELAESLWDGVTYDEMHLAVELLRLRPSLISEALVDRLRTGLDNQAVTDDLASVVRHWVAAEPEAGFAALHRWASEGHAWTRRLALLGTVQLSREGTEIDRTLEIVTASLDDRRHPVANGVSIALRELTKSAPDRVENFVETHADELPAWLRLEVWNKVRFGRKDGKEPRRSARSAARGEASTRRARAGRSRRGESTKEHRTARDRDGRRTRRRPTDRPPEG